MVYNVSLYTIEFISITLIVFVALCVCKARALTNTYYGWIDNTWKKITA